MARSPTAHPSPATAKEWGLTELFSALTAPADATWIPLPGAYELVVGSLPPALILRGVRGTERGWTLSLETDALLVDWIRGESGFRAKRQTLFLWWSLDEDLPSPQRALALGERLADYRALTFRAGSELHLVEALEVLLPGRRWPSLRSAVAGIDPSWLFARDLPDETMADLEAIARWAWPEGSHVERAGGPDNSTFLAPIPLNVHLSPEARAGWSAHERLDRGARLRAVADGIRDRRPVAASRLEAAA